MDSNTTSGANRLEDSISKASHLTVDQSRRREVKLWSSSSRHPAAAVARKTRAIGRELFRTVMALPTMLVCHNVRIGVCRLLALLRHHEETRHICLRGWSSRVANLG